MGGAEVGVQTWFAFLQAHRVATRALEGDLAMTDVTPVAFEVLQLLDDATEAGLSAADLSGVLQVPRRRLDGICDHLIEEGYLARRRDDDDRRITRLGINPSGRQALARAAPIHLAGVHRHFLDGLTQKERRELRASMGKVLALNGATRS